MGLHELLTDQGCYTHTHQEADFDDGDPENGPGHGGHAAYDLYEGDSHDIIVQDGIIVDMQLIDWDAVRFMEAHEALHEAMAVKFTKARLA